MPFLRHLTPLALALIVPAVAGCGVSTGLDLYEDGGFPSRRDGGPMRVDGGRDAGPPSRCDSADDCDDGLVCNGAEFCAGDRCGPGRPVLCDDGISCTVDACVEGAGSCTSRPDDSRCDFGLRCDPFRDCVPVTMGCGSDFECDDGDLCNGSERCDFGTCVPGSGIVCPVDFIDCTIESCDPLLGCTSVADSSLCPIGEICVPTRGCARVACMSEFDCNDGDPCNGNERCDLASNLCRAGMPLRCDDGSACTIDRCIPFSGCTSSVETERCTDGRDNDCNGLTDCADGTCRSMPICGMCAIDETSLDECTDGLDGDCDGVSDCADPGCTAFPGQVDECCNFADDNGNGFVDEFTCSCGTDVDCSSGNVCWTLLGVCAPRCNTLGGTPFCNMIQPGLRCDAGSGQCVF